jgi:hypothetical protein
MDEPIPSKTVLGTGLDLVKARTATIPPGKNNAVIVGVDWKFGVPYSFRFGWATRRGEHFQLSAEAETRFSGASTNAGVYAAWTW